MKKLLALVALGLLSLPLMAQEPAKSELFAGYEYLRFGGSSTGGVTTSAQGFNGWTGEVTYNFMKHLGVTADLGGGYATISGISSHYYTLTGGPTVTLGTERRLALFAHALAGLARATTSTSSQDTTGSVSQNGFTMMAGGGIDVRISKAISFRLVQADWMYYRFGGIGGGGVSSQSNNGRFSVGIVYRFTPFS